MRANTRRQVYSADSHAIIESLARDLAHKKMQPLLLTLEPDGECGEHPYSSIEGEEFAIVLRGRIVFEQESGIHELGMSNAIYFNPELPHNWRKRTCLLPRPRTLSRWSASSRWPGCSRSSPTWLWCCCSASIFRPFSPSGITRPRALSSKRRSRSCPRSIACKRSIEEHAGLQDRLANTGQIRPDLAVRLGLIGVAGRASGQGLDLRVQCPIPPYDRLKVNITTHQDGDVEARVAVRFGELRESLRLQQEILAQLPEGAIHTPLNPSAPFACGIGWVEGWRGEVFSWVRADESNRIDRCHPHDPSWVLWPALEYAVLGDIVPDFPLVNKSFNLSYSGHDL
jgi:hypothetical protein